MLKTNHTLLIVVDFLTDDTHLYAIHPTPAEKRYILQKLNGLRLTNLTEESGGELLKKMMLDWKDSKVQPKDIELESFDYTYVIQLM